jgi:hypothetical protein
MKNRSSGSHSDRRLKNVSAFFSPENFSTGKENKKM